MKVYSYVVARDYGFAPNPFFGICTLATCKPNIRRKAAIGDWIVGTGSKQCARHGCLVFWMQVCEILTFDQYWIDERFICKRPNLQGSLKQAFGDNIYHRDDSDSWVQLNSHHSYADGTHNIHNVQNDTKVDRVLLGHKYCYWGGEGPLINQAFRNYQGIDICASRNHKSCQFSDDLIRDLTAWLLSLCQYGYSGDPQKWHL